MFALARIKEWFVEKLMVPLIVGIVAFGAGYALHWHQSTITEAKKDSKQEAVTTTSAAAVDGTDKQAITRLQAALTAAKNRSTSLEQQLKDQSNANPAPAVCALPERLRDQINADLASGSR